MHGPPRAPRDRRYSTQAWRRVREQVRERDQRTCQACGRTEPVGGRKTFPVDHRDPAADFYDPANLWLLCWSCNTSKSGMSVDEWHARARRPVGNGVTTPYADRRPKAAPDLVIRPTAAPPRNELEAEAAAIRATVGRHRAHDWSTAPIVDREPGHHQHPRWGRVTVDRYSVCPPGCTAAIWVRWAA